MRFRSSALLVCALWGCRQTAPGPTLSSAAAPRPQPSSSSSSLSRSGTALLSPGEPAALQLIASGKELTLTARRDEVAGARVRIWSKAFSASARANAGLIVDQLPEPWVGAPFDPKRQTLTYAGDLPSSFALRRNDVPCLAVDDSTLLVLLGKKWLERRLRSRALPPHALLAWGDGALLVDSQIQACGWATSSPVEQLAQPTGTVFTQVAPDGSLSHPSLDLDPSFMAWGGSSTGQTLALVGTFGVRADADAGVPAIGSRDIVAMRRHGQGPFKASLIVRAEGAASQSLRTQIREFGSAALLWPPPAHDDGTPVAGALAEGGDEIAWKGHASSIFLLNDAGSAELSFRTASEQDCQVAEATLAGDDVYALVACPSQPARLVRATRALAPQAVTVPRLGPLTCVPTQIIGLGPNDLWLRAACGGTPNQPETIAIFRQGHAQPPLQVP